MMDFLRGLAPQHAHAKTRAVAALGSRFESDQPMRRVPASAIAEVQRDDAEAESGAQASPRIEPARHVDAAVQLRDLVASRPVTSGAPADRDQSVEGPLSSIRLDLPNRHEEPVVRERPVSTDAGLPSPMARPMRSQAVARAALATPVASPFNEARVDRTPLSQEAIAARMTPQAERPAVVHVTIDRIDVRAPSSTDHRSKPQARSRAAASHPSLADYLRARHSGRRGGSS